MGRGIAWLLVPTALSVLDLTISSDSLRGRIANPPQAASLHYIAFKNF
jgi:hypothetical protein